VTSRSQGSDAHAPGSGDLHSEVLLATAGLVWRLKQLADRYDGLPIPEDQELARARQRNIALMRETAASGRRLLAGLGPLAEGQTEWPASAQPGGNDERARARDRQAAARDDRAEARDLRASLRDRDAEGDDPDRGFASRFLAAGDRDDAAGDRAHAQADRDAARMERLQELSWWAAHGPPVGGTLMDHLDATAAVHQAQGLLMARSGIAAAEAFEALLLASRQQGMPLGEFAAQAVQEARRAADGAERGHG
jgi:hypothetical protein